MARGDQNTPRSRATATIIDVSAPALPVANLSMTPTQEQSSLITAEILASLEHDPTARGELITLRDGTELSVGSSVAGHTVGRYTMRGIDDISGVDYDPDTFIVKVNFHSGPEALVSADRTTVDCSCGATVCPHRIAALAAAMVHPGSNTMDDLLLASHRDAMAEYFEDPNATTLAFAAASAQVLMEEQGGFAAESFDLPESYVAREKEMLLSVDEDEAVAATPERVTELRQRFGRKIRGAQRESHVNRTRMAAALSVDDYYDKYWDDDERKILEELNQIADPLAREDRMYELDFDGLPKQLLALREKTSTTLGLPIPEDPGMVIDSDLANTQRVVINALSQGRRTFGFYGPQGTGKNTFADMLASHSGMPVFEIDCSQSDDFNEMLVAPTLREGEKGGTIKDSEVGPLLKAASAEGGAVIVFNEIVEAPRGQLTAIHNLIGSGVAGKQRYYTAKTSSGKNTRIPIDDQTIFVLTWNPDREGRRPHAALSSRMVNVAFDHPDEEAEVERTAVRVWDSIGTKLAAKQNWKYDSDAVDERGERVPISKQIPELAEMLRPDVQFARMLRVEYYGGDLDHCADSRTMVTYSSSRILDKFSEHEDTRKTATEANLHLWDFVTPQDGKREERFNSLLKHARDVYPADEGLSQSTASAFFNN